MRRIVGGGKIPELLTDSCLKDNERSQLQDLYSLLTFLLLDMAVMLWRYGHESKRKGES